MHSAVMQNKDYIEFAKNSTVEVLALSGLDRAVSKKDPKAATYKKDGKELLVQWPSLSYDEVMELAGDAELRAYNDAGYIPYTCIVDPYTKKKLGSGYRDVKSIREAVEKFTGELAGAKKGKTFASRVAAAEKLADEGEYAKALRDLKKVKAKGKFSKAVKAKLEARKDAASERIIAKAKAAYEAALALPAEEAVPALKKMLPRLRGTKLDREAGKELRKRQKELKG
jgi:hypothetical protein